MNPDIMLYQLVIETHEYFGHMETYKIYDMNYYIEIISLQICTAELRVL